MIENIENKDDCLLTIGMPIYNNQNTLVRAINSILAHEHLNFKIILSDDGSTDDSWALCQTLAAKDRRITAIKQPVNLYYNNFRYVLDAAETPYFCWLAGDDYFENGFLNKAIELLQQQADAVGAIGTCKFYRGDKFVEVANGSYQIAHEKPEDRIAEYLSVSTDNSRMYGVFRTAPAQNSFPKKLFYSYDCTFSALTLLHGKHIHVQMDSVHRDKTEIESYRKLIRKDAKNIITRLFPLVPMTAYLFRQAEFPVSRLTFKKLMMLNFNFHLNYCEYYHPKYYHFLIAIQNEYTKRIGWRFKKRNKIK